MTPPRESPAINVDDELASLAIVPRTVSPHLDALGEKAKDYARNARAQNTRRAYESDWRQFSSWLRRQGFASDPPDPQTVGLYLAACADGAGRITAMNVASLERRLSGIAWHYRQLGKPLDTRDRHIATVLAGIRRAHGRPPVQKEAIFADDLLAMLATLDNDVRGLRDRAILAIGFAGGLRRSEIVGLDCGPNQSEDGTCWIEIFGAAKGRARQKTKAGTPAALKTRVAPMFREPETKAVCCSPSMVRPAGVKSRSAAAPAPSPAPSRCSKPGCGSGGSPTVPCSAASPRKTRASPPSA
jgi:integrase